jgi:hypothetical protein
MTALLATPRFGGPRNVPSYYAALNDIIRTLRPASTLRTVCYHLNAQGFKTPSGLEWTRERLAGYLHTAAI